MYRLDLYSTTGTTTAVDSFFPPTITIKGWTHRINAPGKLVFSIRADDENATDSNLRKFRRVRLYRRPQDGTATYEAIWLGYIESTREIDGNLEVLCMGMLEYFKKRYTGSSETFNGQGSTEAFGLITDTNTDGETGIITGAGGVTSTKTLTIDRKDMLRGWEELAQAHGAEFEIDSEGAFNFVSALGTDKSGSVELQFRRDGVPGGNVESIEIGEDGEPMANRVNGYTSAAGGLTSTKEDATSQTTYGLLIERKSFGSAQDQGTLDSMTESYLSQVANPLQDYRIKPSLARKILSPVSGTRTVSGLQYGDLVVGDLVSVIIQTKSQDVEATRRVAEIIVSVDENQNESLKYTLTQSGVFITAAFLDIDQTQELRRKIRELEALV